jgi:dihydrofolate reductase
MVISIIAALAENRVIGRNGAIPWDIPEDRRRFRELTMGHPVIMGRKTFEAIGQPLPGRKNIVLTRQAGYRPDGCLVAHDLAAALAACAGSDEVFICGGGEIYREALPLAERLYLTRIPRKVEGDTFFPEFAFREFEVTERRPGQDVPSCDFIVLTRRHCPAEGVAEESAG